MVCDTKQTILCSTELDIWTGMDSIIFSDGNIVLPNLETRGSKKESENSRSIFSRTTWTEFSLVSNLLWSEITRAGTHGDRVNVGVDTADNEEVLSFISGSILFIGAISALGQFCLPTQCSNSNTKLI